MSYRVEPPLERLAFIPGSTICDAEGRVVAQMAAAAERKHVHLIAAAPDLLEAAKIGLELLDGRCEQCQIGRCDRCRFQDMRDQIEAAITKAKGGEER